MTIHIHDELTSGQVVQLKRAIAATKEQLKQAEQIAADAGFQTQDQILVVAQILATNYLADRTRP